MSIKPLSSALLGWRQDSLATIGAEKTYREGFKFDESVLDDDDLLNDAKSIAPDDKVSVLSLSQSSSIVRKYEKGRPSRVHRLNGALKSVKQSNPHSSNVEYPCLIESMLHKLPRVHVQIIDPADALQQLTARIDIPQCASKTASRPYNKCSIPWSSRKVDILSLTESYRDSPPRTQRHYYCRRRSNGYHNNQRFAVMSDRVFQREASSWLQTVQRNVHEMMKARQRTQALTLRNEYDAHCQIPRRPSVQQETACRMMM